MHVSTHIHLDHECGAGIVVHDVVAKLRPRICALAIAKRLLLHLVAAAIGERARGTGAYKIS
jgi:hypothetical protein